MKYLLLIYHNPGTRQIWDAFSEGQQAEGLAAYAALNEELLAGIHLVDCESIDRAVEIAA